MSTQSGEIDPRDRFATDIAFAPGRSTLAKASQARSYKGTRLSYIGAQFRRKCQAGSDIDQSRAESIDRFSFRRAHCRLRARPMTRVAGVIGGHERPLAPPVDQGPALVGLAVVVELAQPVEQVQHGDVGLGPVDAVVGLQVGGPRPTPLSGARRGTASPGRSAGAALGRRPRWATLTTSLPLVTTAFKIGSPPSMVSRTAWVLTGPKPATSHTSAPTG